MNVRGIGFVGTATAHRTEMANFVRDVLGLEELHAHSLEADLFRLADGTVFAVADAETQAEAYRTVGFHVDDLDEALAGLEGAGIDVAGGVQENDRDRYVHFRAPDGRLYELVAAR